MKKLKIGKIVGTHALKGELKIRSMSDFNQQRMKKGKTLFIICDKQELELEIVAIREHKSNFLVTFKDLQDINLVERYVGLEVFANKEEELLGNDEYYQEDVIGCDVDTTTNIHIGKVESIMDNGRHDILIVNGEKGKVRIPYVDAFVIKEDIKNKKIIVKLIKGMLNED